MSKDKALEFYNALKTDKAMAEEMKKAAEGVPFDSLENAVDFTVRFAANKGYSFTAADVKAIEDDAKELSPEEMDGVSAAGHCFRIFRSTGPLLPKGHLIENGDGSANIFL